MGKVFLRAGDRQSTGWRAPLFSHSKCLGTDSVTSSRRIAPALTTRKRLEALHTVEGKLEDLTNQTVDVGMYTTRCFFGRPQTTDNYVITAQLDLQIAINPSRDRMDMCAYTKGCCTGSCASEVEVVCLLVLQKEYFHQDVRVPLQKGRTKLCGNCDVIDSSALPPTPSITSNHSDFYLNIAFSHHSEFYL